MGGGGPATTTHASRQDARQALIDYVRRNWEAEIDEESPADEDELVDRYFAEVLESYEIAETAA